tara:strand:- start:1793 stop:2308 length:516 start_codon:yes stop_codon:yes gene_type:complete
MGTYVEIKLDEFKKEIENEMGFTCVNPNREVSNPSGGYAEEYIYERVVKHHNPDDMMQALRGDAFRYAIRIYSSVDRRTNTTRNSGQDAIRVTLYDLFKERPVKVEKRVNRTQNALVNMRARAREMWQYVSTRNNICPTCQSLLVKRTAKRTKNQFLGCSNYPECKHTQNL